MPAVTTPELERLLGEQLHVLERMIVSPGVGVFQPPATPGISLLESVDVGTVIGRIGDQEIRSAFAGRLMGMLAFPGERVRGGQPVAWLRTG